MRLYSEILIHMPCGGPNKEFSDKQAEEAFGKVMLFLKSKYGIEGSSNSNWSLDREDYADATKKLREALKEMFWCQACDDF